MAFVDENSVADALKILLGGTGLTFKAVPAEDESVDAEVEVLLHGHSTDYTVQVGGGYTVLNEHLYKGEGRGPLDLVASRTHGNYGVCRDDMRALAHKLRVQLLERAA